MNGRPNDGIIGRVLEREITKVASARKPMTEAQVVQFVRDLRDNQRLSWDRIANKLKEIGHISLKTKGPLTAGTVRHIYYYGRKSYKVPKHLKEGPQSSEIVDTLSLIRDILKMPIDAEMKLKLIENAVK